MYELVDLLPDGFFNRYADAWPSLRSKQGECILLVLLLLAITDDNFLEYRPNRYVSVGGIFTI